MTNPVKVEYEIPDLISSTLFLKNLENLSQSLLESTGTTMGAGLNKQSVVENKAMGF